MLNLSIAPISQRRPVSFCRNGLSRPLNLAIRHQTTHLAGQPMVSHRWAVGESVTHPMFKALNGFLQRNSSQPHLRSPQTHSPCISNRCLLPDLSHCVDHQTAALIFAPRGTLRK